MRILFIETPSVFFPRMAGVYFPNPGPITVGAAAERAGHEVEVLDMVALDLPWEALQREVRRRQPDVVCLSAITKTAYASMAAAELVKEVDPGIVLVGGGTHFTLVPEESLRLCRYLDYLVLHEGEVTFLELLDRLERGTPREDMQAVEGLAFQLDGRIVITPPRPLVCDLDDLPSPAYHLLPMDRYSCDIVGPDGFGTSFSRGCAHSCRFCSERVLWREQWRSHSPARMVDELRVLHDVYGKRSFWIGDPDFLHDRERVKGFIAEMESRGPDIQYQIQVRADEVIANADLLPGLAKVGTRVVMMGVETYSDRRLEQLGKGLVNEQAERAARIIKSSGIPLMWTCLIWGHPDDDWLEVFRLLRGSRRLRSDFMAHDLLAPWPGTELFEELDAAGNIAIYDYRAYTFDQPIVKIEGIPLAAAEALNTAGFFLFWFNPLWAAPRLLNRHQRMLQMFSLKASWSVLRTEMIGTRLGGAVKSALGVQLPREEQMQERYYEAHLADRGMTRDQDRGGALSLGLRASNRPGRAV